MSQNKFYKIAILCDVIGLELTNSYIESVLNPEAQSKLRNLKKSIDNISKFVDNSFGKDPNEIHESFGDLCDKINAQVDETINQIQ